MSACRFLDMADDLELGMSLVDPSGIRPAESLCILSTGPSAVPAVVASRCADALYGRPVWTYTNCVVPRWAAHGTDAVLISYSGDAAEILESYRKLRSRGSRIHCITSGGRLGRMARRNGDHLIRVPGGLSARESFGIVTGALAAMLQPMGYGPFADDLRSILPSVRGYANAVSERGDVVHELAMSMSSGLPAVYAVPEIGGAALEWKYCLEDETGRPAFSGEFPEFDHNELVGWADGEGQADCMELVLLDMDLGESKLAYIIDSAVEVLEESGRTVRRIPIEGSGPLERNICAVVLGGAVSAELGRIRRGEATE